MNLYTIIGHLYAESLVQAQTIDELKRQVAALCEERDRLRAEVDALQAEIERTQPKGE